MSKSFSERRAAIVSCYLSNLNEEITASIADNEEAIKSLKAENTELTSLSALNRASIKALSSIK